MNFRGIKELLEGRSLQSSVQVLQETCRVNINVHTAVTMTGLGIVFRAPIGGQVCSIQETTLHARYCRFLFQRAERVEMAKREWRNERVEMSQRVQRTGGT